MKEKPMTDAEMQAERDARTDEVAKNLGFTKLPSGTYRDFFVTEGMRAICFVHHDDSDLEGQLGCTVDTWEEAKRVIDEWASN